MFSLIITIVSIALVVALVAATMYHGGDTLTQGRTTADASAFVAGAQQIAGAQVMHLSLVGQQADTVAAGGAAVAGKDLVKDGYLASAPVVKGGAWVLDTVNRKVTNTTTTQEVCLAIDKAAGVAQAKIDAKTVAAADFADLPYGCDTTGNAFQFKY